MTNQSSVRTLFVDLGGVLLTNGWDHNARDLAIKTFHLEEDAKTIDDRHRLIYDTYELGKMDWDAFLHFVYFYKKREFTLDQFKAFMIDQSKPFPDMLEMMREFKQKYGLKIIVVSNEGRDLSAYRIDTFKLKEIIDCFVISCYVHFRKPDLDIFRYALDLSHALPEETVYIDDRKPYVEIAETLGLKGIHHQEIEMTRTALQNFIEKRGVYG